jgi:hypothetical protein
MPHKRGKKNDGWSKCRQCKSNNIVLVEYAWDHPEHYDGISEIFCQNCGARFGRWTGKKLKDDEYEKRYGGLNPLFSKANRLNRRH